MFSPPHAPIKCLFWPLVGYLCGGSTFLNGMGDQVTFSSSRQLAAASWPDGEMNFSSSSSRKYQNILTAMVCAMPLCVRFCPRENTAEYFFFCFVQFILIKSPSVSFPPKKMIFPSTPTFPLTHPLLLLLLKMLDEPETRVQR